MTSKTETLVDENGIELLVDYAYSLTDSYYEEDGNPGTLVQPSVYTELKSVDLSFGEWGFDILPLLKERQKEFIISRLTYDQ